MKLKNTVGYHATQKIVKLDEYLTILDEMKTTLAFDLNQIEPPSITDLKKTLTAIKSGYLKTLGIIAYKNSQKAQES